MKDLLTTNFTIHGVALEVFGLGLILTGPSNIGKSELALELIRRGHKFIADDSVNIKLENHRLILESSNPPFIHIREIGFVNIERIYGSSSIANRSNLDMIVHLTNTNGNIDPIEQSYSVTKFAELNIKTFNLSIGKHRSLANLVELLVKYYQDLINGYDSHADFLHYNKMLLSEAPNAVNSN